MPFIAKPDGEKKFGENTRVLSIRIPESQFETIKKIVYNFIDSYSKDNLQTIKTTQNGIEDFERETPTLNFNKKKINQLKQEVETLKQTIKDLLSNPNDLLLEKSTLKITGFSPKDFYERFIYVTNGEKPIIKWNGNALFYKLEYQKTLKQLENQRKLDNLFYFSKEWLKRSNEVSSRDKEKCIYCGKKCHTVHHKKSALYNPELCLDPNNLITVCKECEDDIHYRNRKKKR